MEFKKGKAWNKHAIESNNVLVCSDTGRVVAVFYSEDDMNAVLRVHKPVAVKIIQIHSVLDNDNLLTMGLGDDGVVYKDTLDGWEVYSPLKFK